MNRLVDQGARDAALDPGGSYIVEAPAGSGKTELLTARFIRLLSLVEDPRSILALTFSRKAAAQMKERVVQHLGEAHQGKNYDGEGFFAGIIRDGKKALEAHGKSGEERELLLSGELFNITTFHGFCQRIVTAAPLESGIAPGLRLLEGWEAEALLAESVERALTELLELPRDDPRHRALNHWALRMDNRMEGVAGLLEKVLGRWDRLFDLMDFAREGEGGRTVAARTLDRLGAIVEAVLFNLKERFSATRLGRGWGEFVGFLEDAGAPVADTLTPVLPGTSWDDLTLWKAAAEALLTKSGTPRRSFGPKMGGYPGGFSNTPLAELVRELPPDASSLLNTARGLPLREETPDSLRPLEDLIILCAHALDSYHGLARERGFMDFVDMERGAIRALSDASDIALWLDFGLNHLLVDEFQDTSRAQWDLIRLLTDGFSPGDGRTVFLVGDPKQSVYGWRNAEVGLFFDAKSGIPTSGGGAISLGELHLETNFRSAAELVGFSNSIFSGVMADPDPIADEVPFGPGAPGPDAAPTCPEPVTLALFTKGEDTDPRTQEARWLAGEVSRLLGVDPDKSIGILLFARTHLGAYLAALRETGVPVRVEEGQLLRERPEIREFVNLACALANPHDDVAFAGLLRSSFFWADAGLLYEAAKSPGVTWEEKARGMAGDVEDLSRLIDTLDRARMRLGREPLAGVAGFLWEELGGPALAARFGARGVANVREALSLMLRVEAGLVHETLERFLFLLEREAYEPADPAAPTSPVMMMTVHKAKGLEFDSVFVPNLDRKPAGGSREPEPFLMARVPGRAQYLMGVLPDRRAREGSEPVYEVAKMLDRTRRTGEAKRVFYVAATRAKERLFLSGAAKLDESGLPEIKRGDTSFLGWLYHNLGPGPETRLLVDPVAGEDAPAALKEGVAVPEPLELVPEKPGYRLVSPSGLALFDEHPPGWEDSPSQVPRARGVVIHRVMETVFSGGALPGDEAIEAALRAEGLDMKDAAGLAPDILREVKRCLEDDFLRGLLEAGEEIQAEMALEDMPKPDRFRSGSLDLVVLKDGVHWLIDFKTARPEPGQDIETFLAREAETYRPQVEAYLEMFVAASSRPREKVAAGLYFTAPGRFVRLV